MGGAEAGHSVPKDSKEYEQIHTTHEIKGMGSLTWHIYCKSSCILLCQIQCEQNSESFILLLINYLICQNIQRNTVPK